MKANTKELDDALNFIAKSENPRVKVPEEEFKKTLLPIVLARHNGQSPAVYGWVNRVGNIYDGVDVVDSQGGVLFSTPGLMINPDLTVEAGFHSMIRDVANDQSHKLDPAATYSEHLNPDKAKLSFENSSEHILEWYRVFARYGYRMVDTRSNKPADASVQAEAPKKPESDVDWGDDEFV